LFWSLLKGKIYGVRELKTIKQPVIAKITRPVIKGIVLRKRLFQLIDDYKKKPVIWTSGPPGCGKTTHVGHFNIPLRYFEELYSDAKDWYGLIRLILSHAQSLIAQGRIATL